MQIGKRVRGSLYLHRSALASLPPADAARLGELAALVDFAWNVVRIAPDGVSLLQYADFDDDPTPALVASCSKRDAMANAVRRSYAGRSNPPVLHRKELLVDQSHPRRAGWTEATGRLVARGAFIDGHLIGTRSAWAARLVELRITPDGHPM